MSTKGWVAAVVLVALAGGGYAAWKYSGHDCCRAPDRSAEPKASTAGAVPDDATLIASQGYCPVMTDTKLGEMGDPIKVMVTGKDGGEQPVFVCARGASERFWPTPTGCSPRWPS
jgi:hypothetical protein